MRILTSIKNRTILCLLIMIMLSSFFFVRSVIVREPYIVGTFVGGDGNYYQHGTSMFLSTVNNWLKDGAFNLRFMSYYYPASIEMPTLDKRHFYGSFPPGGYIPIYILFKTLDSTFIPGIYEKRGTQLLLIIFYNYSLHFLLALVLCSIAFLVCRNLGFNRRNSTIFAIIPSILQFNNPNSLYWHHLTLFHDILVLPLFSFFVLLELIRITCSSSNTLRILRIIQPLLMFCATLTSWFFVFAIITVYIIRILRKEVDLPVSLQKTLHWVRQSFIFFAPAIAAIIVWISQLIYYSVNISQSNLFDTGISSYKFTLVENILFRMGITDVNNSILHLLYNLEASLYTHIQTGYGISGMLMIYFVFYLAIRRCKFMTKEEIHTNNLASITYLMFFIPYLLYSLTFSQANATHQLTSLMFSPALSLSFVLCPILIIQLIKKGHMYLSYNINEKKNISLAALLALGSVSLYACNQNYSNVSVIKMFSPPMYKYPVIGNFIRKNTSYQDVVFSNISFVAHKILLKKIHFPAKVIHPANTLEDIYQKIKNIEQKFTIKIFYFDNHKDKVKNISNFLVSRGLNVNFIYEKKVGWLLSFNGNKFIAWYKHECDLQPQECAPNLKAMK